MVRQHKYQIQTEWTGNLGSGTSDYRSYSRNHEISGKGKLSVIMGSSVSAFRGNPERYNPEEMLVGALSSCHMLWVLHLCADAGITVVSYVDTATGEMVENKDGSGHFKSVTLNPHMTITDQSQIEKAKQLHVKAHEMCFIASSVNFEVTFEPVVVSA